MSSCVMLVAGNTQTLPVNGFEDVRQPLVFLADILQEAWMGISIANGFCIIVCDCLFVE